MVEGLYSRDGKCGIGLRWIDLALEFRCSLKHRYSCGFDNRLKNGDVLPDLALGTKRLLSRSGSRGLLAMVWLMDAELWSASVRCTSR